MAQNNYTAIIDQDNVTDEVKDIAVKYDPLNRSGKDGFYVNDDGELKIEENNVMKSHRIIQKKIPNDSVRIVELPSESGNLIHQFGKNSFRLYNLPRPNKGQIIGLIGRNGIGKTTALKILSGEIEPNMGKYNSNITLDESLDRISDSSTIQHLKDVHSGDFKVSRKPQIASEYNIDKKVGDILETQGNMDIIDNLSIDNLLTNDLSSLSGGELQKVLLARVLETDSDIYIFDEPSSFLDVGQRITASDVIKNNIGEDSVTFIVDHDLTFLESICDTVHILYGEPNSYGVVSNPLSTRNGINNYVKGYVSSDEVMVRNEKFEFDIRGSEDKKLEDIAIKYDDFNVSLGSFDLFVNEGSIRESQVIGILGENGLGKTTFAKSLAGKLKTEQEFAFTVSYKPQYLDINNENISVKTYISQIPELKGSISSDLKSKLEIENLMNQDLGDLSGGELQRLSIAICISREADIYVLDEPSAYLDVEKRNMTGKVLNNYSSKTGKPILVIDHDIFLINTVSDDIIVFRGEPGVKGEASTVMEISEGMNEFLSDMDITLRKDKDTKRPKVNKKDSQLDRKQKKQGDYYK